jgi:O-antigen ligase
MRELSFPRPIGASEVVAPRAGRHLPGRLAVTAWLLGLLAAPMLMDKLGLVVHQIALAWLLPPMILWRGSPFVRAPVFRREPWFLVATSVFLVLIFPGAALSDEPETSLAYWVGTIIAILMAAGLWELGAEVVERGLAIYGVTGALWSIAVVMLFHEEGQRLGGFQGPNSLALVELGIATAALCVRSGPVRLGVLAVSLGTIAITGSRAGLLAAAAMLATLLVASLPRLSIRRVALGTMAIGALLAAIWWAIDHTVNRLALVFAFDDPTRNPIESGFSGRLYAWLDAIELWQGHPWFGVGYRMHERYFSDYSSAHNGFLMALAEFGVVGMVPTLVMLTMAVRRAVVLASQGDRLGRVALAFFVGMAVESLFERYLINIGNATSILLLVFLFRPRSARPALRSSGPRWA